MRGFANRLAEEGFLLRPLSWADAETANALPALHKDPSDRMLIAQAANAGLAVVTQDRVVADDGVAVIW